MRPDAKPMGTARTSAERAAEKVLAGVEQWRGRELSYAPVSGGLQNSNWRVDIAGDEGKAFGRQPAGAQLFRRLAAPLRPHGTVEQVLARDDVARILGIDYKCSGREKRAQGVNNSGHRGLPLSKPLQADRTKIVKWRSRLKTGADRIR